MMKEKKKMKTKKKNFKHSLKSYRKEVSIRDYPKGWKFVQKNDD